MKKISLTTLIWIVTSPILFSQSYYFNNSISRQVLENYLDRTLGFQQNAGITASGDKCWTYIRNSLDPWEGGCALSYNNEWLNEDKILLANTKAKFIRRLVGRWSWGCNSWDPINNCVALHFEKAEELAEEFHSVDSEMILESAIFEQVPKDIPKNKLEIPTYVEEAFGVYNSTTDYFDWTKMIYPNSTKKTPDISQLETRMWVYFLATNYIDAGYESIHFGHWTSLNNSDTETTYKWVQVDSNGLIPTFALETTDHTNKKFYELLQKIRQYAESIDPLTENPRARRGIILITAAPIYKYGDMPFYRQHIKPPVGSDEYHAYHLFDFWNSTLKVDEREKILNPDADLVPEYPNHSFDFQNSGDDHHDRLVDLRTSVFPLSGGTFSLDPNTHMYPAYLQYSTNSNWNWDPSDTYTLPTLLVFDVGGNPQYFVEGEKTVDGTMALNDDTGNMDHVPYLTWGWGGEASWFSFQSEAYRNHFLTYVYEASKALNTSCYIEFPAHKNTYSHIYENMNGSGGLAWKHRLAYRANTSTPNPPYTVGFNQEETIKNIWEGAYELDFCGAGNSWNNSMVYANGWSHSDYILTTADVTGDGKSDLVGFKNDGVYVSPSSGSYFQYGPSKWVSNFGTNQGWKNDNFHLRLTGDVTGDGKDDIIGFGNDDVFVGVSFLSYFSFSKWNTSFAKNDGWNNVNYVRTLGDVDNDGKLDIIGFGFNDVWVAKSNGGSFLTRISWNTTDFNYNDGWSDPDYIRTTGDFNGDGLVDIIGFKDDGVHIGINTGSSFDDNVWSLLPEFGTNQGWNNTHDRLIADVDGDGKDDIVGFKEKGVMVSLSTGTGFKMPEYWIYYFGNDIDYGGYNTANHLRQMGDINGDGKADIVGFTDQGIEASISIGKGFAHHKGSNFGFTSGWQSGHARYLTSVSDDATPYPRVEVVGFHDYNVYVQNCNSSNNTFKKPEEIIAHPDPNFTVYPNPNQGRCIFNISLPNQSNADLRIYNSLGQIESVIWEDKNMDAGEYKYKWDASQGASGVYFVVLIVNGKRFAQKVMISK